MFPFRRSLILVTSLALMPLAGVASAGQSRQRSEPRSQGSSSSGSSSQGSSDQGRSRTQAQPRQRESTPQQQQPQQQQQSQRQQQPQRQTLPQSQRTPQQYQRPQQQQQYARPQQNDQRYSNQQQYSTRQAIPAPRDRYIPQNRDGRYQSYGNVTRYDGRYDRYDSRYSNYSPYRYDGPRVLFAPRESMRFSSPWFSFRALVRLPFGLTLGVSTPFPSWYRPYIVGRPGYTQPYMPYGGVTFDIQPGDAELWIDGEYMGRASDYDYTNPPLTLVAGLHSVELRSGYGRPLAFDITIIPGQVIPYQGSLPYDH
jgi:hypothetical protein